MIQLENHQGATTIHTEGRGLVTVIPDKHVFTIDFQSVAKTTEILSQRYNDFMAGIEEIAKKHDENAKIERGALTVNANVETVKKILNVADTQGYAIAFASCTITSTKDAVSTPMYNNVIGFSEAMAEKVAQEKKAGGLFTQQKGVNGIVDSLKTSVRVTHTLTNEKAKGAYDTALWNAYTDAERKAQAVGAPMSIGNENLIEGLGQTKYYPLRVEIGRTSITEETVYRSKSAPRDAKTRAGANATFEKMTEETANFENAAEPTPNHIEAQITVIFQAR